MFDGISTVWLWSAGTVLSNVIHKGLITKLFTVSSCIKHASFAIDYGSILHIIVMKEGPKLGYILTLNVRQWRKILNNEESNQVLPPYFTLFLLQHTHFKADNWYWYTMRNTVSLMKRQTSNNPRANGKSLWRTWRHSSRLCKNGNQQMTNVPITAMPRETNMRALTQNTIVKSDST